MISGWPASSRPSMLSNEPQQHATETLEQLCKEVETPLTHFQHQLNPWVAYVILPLFAFANAGVPLGSGFSQLLGSPVTWGVVVGLVLGKPLGITLFSWLAVRLGVAFLPSTISWRQIIGVAWLGGIGFTISLFVAELAFEADTLGDAARMGILVGSVVAGAIGYLILWATLPSTRDGHLARRPELQEFVRRVTRDSNISRSNGLRRKTA